jgi:hypothetical protein
VEASSRETSTYNLSDALGIFASPGARFILSIVFPSIK